MLDGLEYLGTLATDPNISYRFRVPKCKRVLYNDFPWMLRDHVPSILTPLGEIVPLSRSHSLFRGIQPNLQLIREALSNIRITHQRLSHCAEFADDYRHALDGKIANSRHFHPVRLHRIDKIGSDTKYGIHCRYRSSFGKWYRTTYHDDNLVPVPPQNTKEAGWGNPLDRTRLIQELTDRSTSLANHSLDSHRQDL